MLHFYNNDQLMKEDYNKYLMKNGMIIVDKLKKKIKIIENQKKYEFYFFLKLP
jgi:hypothetical protein